MAATADVAETAEVAEMAEAAKMAEAEEIAAVGAATVEAEAVKVASEAEVKFAQTLGLDHSSPQTLARLWVTRCAPRERHEDEYWVVDSGATGNMTQDSLNLEDYTPPPLGDEVESAGVFFSLLQDMGA